MRFLGFEDDPATSRFIRGRLEQQICRGRSRGWSFGANDYPTPMNGLSLLDIGIAEMDGLGVYRRNRESPYFVLVLIAGRRYDDGRVFVY